MLKVGDKIKCSDHEETVAVQRALFIKGVKTRQVDIFKLEVMEVKDESEGTD